MSTFNFFLKQHRNNHTKFAYNSALPFKVGKTYGLWKCVDTIASEAITKQEAVAS